MNEYDKAIQDLEELQSQIDDYKRRVRQTKRGCRYEDRKQKRHLENILYDLQIQAKNLKSYIDTIDSPKG